MSLFCEQCYDSNLAAMVRNWQDILSWWTSQDCSLDDDVFGNMSSFKVCYLLPGDVCYIPPCSVVVEKALSSHNISGRVLCMMASHHSTEVFGLYKDVYPAFLGCTGHLVF